MNSEIGLPLTIIGAPNAWRSVTGWFKNVLDGLELILWRAEYPDCLILEIGADHPGDIRKVTKWLKPDITVITKISDLPVHVEFFSSPEEVFKEKAYLAHAIKDNGSLILYGDNDKVSKLGDDVLAARTKDDKGAKKKENGPQINIIRYGIGDNSTVRASNVDINYLQTTGEPIGMKFDLILGDAASPVIINGALGNSYIYALLAAAACGKAKNVSGGDILKGLSEYEAPKGRMNIIGGVNGSIVIDDSYNSSPDAVQSALMTLEKINCNGRKIVAFGDMMELGKYASDEHRLAGVGVAKVANALITVGQRSELATVAAAKEAGMSAETIKSFDSSEDAGKYLTSIVKAGDIVLVKGSQSIRMERVVKALMADPNKAGELLVRQEKEWLDKK
jgi:UDP-N-acetylmuramoyl-tripeptide--D-alanyl-D-alanine ligase